MKTRLVTFVFVSISTATMVFGQQPPRAPRGAPPGHPPRPMEAKGPNRPGVPPQGDWSRPHDANGNGNLEAEEFQAAIERTFAEFDKNGNGSIDASEAKMPPKPQPAARAMGDGPRPGQSLGPMPDRHSDGKRILPPFFFLDRLQENQSITRANFDKLVWGVFAGMDKNGDRTLNRDEAYKMPKRPGDPPRAMAPRPPNAPFVEALQFGDRLVTGQPFSAETVIEDTKRLFDGTAAKQEKRGAIHRDGAGRTRREQPLDIVGPGGVSAADTQRITLVFINDFPAKTQYSLDQANKVARKSPIWSNNWPFPETDGPKGAKITSIGTKMIEGVSAEGTQTTFEIPAGQIGNEKPLQVVSEKWFSPELQVVIMSRHLDPVAGEHIFRLVNIKRNEPAADLFTVPTGYRIENAVTPRPE